MKALKKVVSYSIIARNRRLVGRWNMLEKIIELTNEYIESMPKKERKKYGQFFTSMETARFMAGLYNVNEKIKENDSVIEKGEDVNTLPTTKAVCPECGHTEASWWLQQTRSADEAETRFFKCLKCGHTWREYD